MEKELDQEKNFFHVSRASLKFFLKSKIANFWSVVLYLTIFILLLFLGYLIVSVEGSTIVMEKFVTTIITIATSLLGFLITGFAIYTALADKDLIYVLINVA